MIRGLYTAATGMNAQQSMIDTIANNLSNVNTTGFKKSRPEFQDLVYQYLVDPGAPTSGTTKSPTGLYVGLGVKPVGTTRMFGQGDLVSTSNPLDVAIEGDGFFSVTMPDGSVAYTRAGNFRLNDTGQLVTADGYEITGASPIPEGAKNIRIAEDGQISYTDTAGTQGQAGQIESARFLNPSGLRSTGRNLFEETEASGTATTGQFGAEGFGKLSQGFLESSNVSVVQEVVQMITAQRAYEAASKGVTTSDEMLGQAINLKR